MPPLHLRIQYDPGQGDEDAALALARRLFARFDEAIDSLALIPTAEADFALYWNGRLVCSQRASGKAPQVADLLALMRQNGQSADDGAARNPASNVGSSAGKMVRGSSKKRSSTMRPMIAGTPVRKRAAKMSSVRPRARQPGGGEGERGGWQRLPWQRAAANGRARVNDVRDNTVLGERGAQRLSAGAQFRPRLRRSCARSGSRSSLRPADSGAASRRCRPGSPCRRGRRGRAGAAR